MFVFFVTSWTIAHQAPLSMEFSRQESGVERFPFPSPGHLPDPGIKSISPTLADGFFTTEGFYRDSIPLLYRAAAAAAKSLQSWPTLCNLIDASPPGSPDPGILQARTLEWVTIPYCPLNGAHLWISVLRRILMNQVQHS